MPRLALVAAVVAVTLLVGSAPDAHAEICPPSDVPGCELVLGLAVLAVSVTAGVVSLAANLANVAGVMDHRRPGAGWLVAGYALGTIAAVVGCAWAVDDSAATPALLATYGLATIGVAIWATAMPRRATAVSLSGIGLRVQF